MGRIIVFTWLILYSIFLLIIYKPNELEIEKL